MEASIYRATGATLLAAGAPVTPAALGWFGWFDLVVLAMIVAGLLRGRKRGMSVECMDLAQWVAIVGGGALLYRPGGQLMASLAGMSPLFGYVVTYLLIAAVFKALSTVFKRSVGEKLVSSETFGGLEYYLGMAAGVCRFTCILVFVLAPLNARLYTASQLQAEEKEQDRNFGDIRFPTLGRLQQSVFSGSFSGRLIRENASFLLIEPTAPGKRLDTLKRERDRDFNRSLGL